MRSFLLLQDCVCAIPRFRVRESGFRRSSGAFRAAVPLAVVMGVVQLSPARAQGFFDFLPWVQSAPEPTASTLPYELTVVVAGDERRVRQSILDASTLQRLRSDPPPDADALVRRAELDLPRVVDALWGAGYYNASVAIEVAGVPLRIGMESTQAAIAAAAPYRGRARAPIRIVVDPGRAFRLRNLRIVDMRTNGPFAPETLPDYVVKLEAGDVARSADVVAAQTRIIDHFRARSQPFARAPRVDPLVDHPNAAVDLTLGIDPGPVAPLGEITVRTPDSIDARVVRSYVYPEPGDPYSPETIASIRRSISQIEAVSAVRIRMPEDVSGLDAFGRLPLDIETGERPTRAAGVSARYSTRDGPGVTAFFTHRNLFGGAERLRLEATAAYLTESGPGNIVRDSSLREFGGRVSASFIKPALGGTRFDLLMDANATREATEGYLAESAGGSIGIQRRFAERISARVRVDVETGKTRDILGEIDYTIVGLPVSATYDSTDKQLDPSRGVRVTGEIAPYFKAFGSTVGFTRFRGSASGYYAVDEEARVVLAARIGVGSISGADLLELPANLRFYAGGGGSVRGFAYKSLSPMIGRVPIGGRSLLEGSVEARIKITETIGVVPFVDAGSAFASSYPDFKEPIRVAAGLGLRYYTAIGPIRLDVAAPLDRKRGEAPIAFYIGFGQAF
ncbi:MAG: BamA/TamA family outer membrane protein [Beijerinckiaceae bacterium]|nr:BamA/TamA family outer membrane protein [Beijerinckiaceae bacterium]